MLKFSNYITASIFLAGILLSPILKAGLGIDKTQSSVHFMSVKNEHIAEVHSFKDFSGSVSDDGVLNIDINLTSVETSIPIRNERMQKMLFDVANFASASFVAKLDKELLDAPVGTSKTVDIKGQLTIQNKTVPTSFSVVISTLENGQIKATTIKPTILNASEFGLDAGIAALQEIAMLKSISKAVPLSFSVTFTPM